MTDMAGTSRHQHLRQSASGNASSAQSNPGRPTCAHDTHLSGQHPCRSRLAVLAMLLLLCLSMGLLMALVLRAGPMADLLSDIPVMPDSRSGEDALLEDNPGIHNDANPFNGAVTDRSGFTGSVAWADVDDDVVLPPEHRLTSYQPRFRSFVRPVKANPTLYAEERQAVIASHCPTIRDIVLLKWLPMARREPDGVWRTHIAFVGDSNSGFMRADVVEDIASCIPGRWVGEELNILCEVPFTVVCRAAVFEPQVTDLQLPDGVLPGTQLVLSSHQLPWSKTAAQALANAYLPLFQNASAEKRRGDYAALFQPSISLDLAPIVRVAEADDFAKPRPGTWLSPSLKLRAPEVLYVSTGAWDVSAAEPVWNDYEMYSHDVYKRPDFGTYFPKLMQTHRASLWANYSEPMRALLRVFADAWEEARFRSGEDLDSLTLSYAPPKKMIVATSPAVDCEGHAYAPGPRPVRGLFYRMFLRGPARCPALVLPMEHVTHSVIRQTVVLAKAEAQQRAEQAAQAAVARHPSSRASSSRDPAAPMPSLAFLSWSERENPCSRADGTHLDRHHPHCRDYVIRQFYSVM